METSDESLYKEIWKQKLLRESDLSADGALRTAAAINVMESGKRFLDVGCGEGTLATRVRERFTELYGVDISEDAVVLARQAGVIAEKINLNIQPLPFPDNYFDVVASLDVIEHVFDPISFIREIHRVLVPGGYAIISTPNIRKIQRILTLIGGRFPRTSYDPVGFDGGHLHYFTSKDMRELLERNSFKVVLTDGICGDRRTWKYRLAVFVLGKNFEKEFLSSAILVKAQKS